MSLDERRRELIERRLRQRGVNVTAEEAIPRVARDGTFPLSFAQARLWFLDQLSPGNPFYNVQTSIRHRGVVDHTALQAAVGLLVERHESLRTVFRVVGGEPRQVVLPVVRVPLEAHDLRHLPPSERQGEAVRIALEQLERPYDLTTGPLLRTKLVRLDEREFVLLVGVHHVVADGWSVGVLSRELGEVYGDLVGGGDGRVLAPLVVQYVDFAVWQRERLAGEWLVGELGWWRGALDGLSGLALPTDRARPAVQGHRGAGFGFVVDRAVVESVGVVARGSSATSFMVALAVWAVVLGRWCGQDEVVVGAPIAGRDRAELEGLIGFFVNTLVLRVDVSGDPTFAELVGRVREVALGAYAHAEVPFEKLVEELAPQRDLSRNPLFQVTFQLFDSPAAEGGIGDGLEIPVSSSLFDIRVDMWPAAGGWAGRVEFDSDLFERASIEALIDRFVWLLGEAAADPRRRIGSWALLPDEHRRLLQQWNDTAAAVPAITVIDAFAEQVTVNADREAVSDDEGTWTYRQLDDESRIVARRLGDARGQVIAVCLPRGRRFAAAALGVMRAGAAYLPLDPAYPTARLSYILAHADADAVITTDDLASQLDLPAATTPITTYTTDTDSRRRRRHRHPRRPGLRHLHLRVHRRTQRRRDRTPQPDQPVPLAHHHLPHHRRRPGHPDRLRRLRRRRVGTVALPHLRRQRAHRHRPHPQRPRPPHRLAAHPPHHHHLHPHPPRRNPPRPPLATQLTTALPAHRRRHPPPPPQPRPPLHPHQPLRTHRNHRRRHRHHPWAPPRPDPGTAQTRHPPPPHHPTPHHRPPHHQHHHHHHRPRRTTRRPPPTRRTHHRGTNPRPRLPPRPHPHPPTLHHTPTPTADPAHRPNHSWAPPRPGPPLPHRRPRPLEPRRHDHLPRPHRPPTQNPRPPHRTRRTRNHHHHPPQHHPHHHHHPHHPTAHPLLGTAQTRAPPNSAPTSPPPTPPPHQPNSPTRWPRGGRCTSGRTAPKRWTTRPSTSAGGTPATTEPRWARR